MTMSGMRCGIVSLAVLLLAAIPPLRVAHAMQFELVDVSATEVMIGGRGPIVHGDAARLERALASVAASKQLLGLAVDSPGGTVVDGAELARMIRDRNLAVIVPTNSKCASACFLMFAAATRRYAANDALIGVHGASDGGKDTTVAMAMTTAMARAAAELGVPPPIVGKIVATEPSRVEWLTHEDLISMGVVIYDDADPPVAARSSTPVVARPEPSPPPPQAQAVSPFDEGRGARHAWDAWLSTLGGPYRDGAVFWAAQRILPEPGSCYGPNGTSRGEFTSGCEAAKQRLIPSDARSRASSDYRMGWNTEAAPTPPSPAVRAEAEFQGAIFCGQEPTQLTLTLFSAPDPLHRRAVYSLGPGSTGRTAPSRSFTIEGRVDLTGGAIDLRPTTLVAQADGLGPVGLQGKSDDGGRTFTGRVTANPRCTMFTLKRMG